MCVCLIRWLVTFTSSSDVVVMMLFMINIDVVCLQLIESIIDVVLCVVVYRYL